MKLITIIFLLLSLAGCTKETDSLPGPDEEKIEDINLTHRHNNNNYGGI